MNTRCLLLAAFLVSPAWAGIGDIDPDFGEGGQLANPAGYAGPFAGPDGSLRYYSFEDGVARILQYDPHGKPDLSFGAQGMQASTLGARGANARAILTRPDGSTYFAVMDTTPSTPGQDDTGTGGALVRFDAMGRHDADFGTGGRVEFPLRLVSGASLVIIESVASASDGSLYVLVGHYRNYYDCASEVRLHRLDAAGRALGDFGEEGSIAYPIGGCHEGPSRLIALDGARMLVDATVRQVVEADGALDPNDPLRDWDERSGRAFLFDEGGHVYAQSANWTDTLSNLVIGRWDRGLAPDAAFGTVHPGYVEFEGPPLFPAETSYAWDHVVRYANAATPMVYIGLSAYDANRGMRTVVARMTPGGELDAAFGEQGYATSIAHVSRVVPLFDGGVVIQNANSRSVRLLDEDRESPGRIEFGMGCTSSRAVYEVDGVFVQQVSRELGRDGPSEMRYHTLSGTAIGGVDYTETQGVLHWDDGESGAREIRVPIARDSATEAPEHFDLVLEATAGGARLECASVRVSINSEVDAPRPQQDSTSGGGGGTLDPGLLLWLLAGLVAPRKGKGMLTSAACLPLPPH